MRILIIQEGATTELSCPDTLAGFVFALKDHFDNIEKGQLSAVWDKTPAPYKKPAAAILNPFMTDWEKKREALLRGDFIYTPVTGPRKGKKTKPLAKER